MSSYGFSNYSNRKTQRSNNNLPSFRSTSDQNLDDELDSLIGDFNNKMNINFSIKHMQRII
jgi:hypothetical protein